MPVNGTMPYLKAAAVFVLAVSLTACGFQLRGSQAATALPESWQRFNLVTGNPNSEFSREVEARFAANGIVWVERNEADYLCVSYVVMLFSCLFVSCLFI